ncbi:unnamed protein product [Scytosiphon promiscuus]
MSDDRRNAGYDVHQGKYRRDFVQELFNDIAQSPGSTARVVCGDGESLGVGDAHRRPLFLFPKNVPDEVVAKYVLRARDARADVIPSSPTIQEGAKSALTSLPVDMVAGPEGGAAKMTVVREAERIVRSDIERQESLKNGTGQGATPVPRRTFPVHDALAPLPGDYRS